MDASCIFARNEKNNVHQNNNNLSTNFNRSGLMYVEGLCGRKMFVLKTDKHEILLQITG